MLCEHCGKDIKPYERVVVITLFDTPEHYIQYKDTQEPYIVHRDCVDQVLEVLE